MKKILLMAVAAIMAISATAQETVKKVRVYNGNTIVFEQDYDDVDSVVFVDVPNIPAGALSGVFSVSETTKVYFSQGNLQYQASTNTWRFAENQYDAIGSANSAISSTNEGWIDLFGWGTSGYDNTANDPFAVNYQPWSTSTAQLSQTVSIKGTEYKSDKTNYWGYGPSTFMTDKNLTGTSAQYDWGVFNAISNGGGQAGMWRTLTREEWDYILNTRNLAQNLRSQATVCGVHGYVLLPDDFVLPDGLSWNYQTNNWDTNTYGPQAWSAMEAVGAVFLPAAGGRGGTNVSDVGSWGFYWSASSNDYQYFAFYLYFDSGNALLDDFNDRYGGFSVRLVRLCSE